MKRFVCCLLVLLSFLFLASADSKPIEAQYSFFVDRPGTYGAKGSKIIDYDSLCVELYVIEGFESGYLSTIRSFSGIVVSSGMVSVSIAERDGLLYFADDNGNYLTGYRDEETEDIWLNFETYEVRLRRLEPARMYTDFR